MKNCPRCDAQLGNTAVACSCGWTNRKAKQETAYMPPPQCSHIGCGLSAYVKIETKTGWATLCEPHYQQHFRDKASKTCEALGLHTTQQKRDWVMKAARSLAAKLRPDYLREPGEDENYRHA